jgi:hypothetical protein
MPPYPDPEYPFYVRAYFAENVEHPLVPGALAFETKHATERSRDLEIAVASKRDDIGEIEHGIRHRIAA